MSVDLYAINSTNALVRAVTYKYSTWYLRSVKLFQLTRHFPDIPIDRKILPFAYNLCLPKFIENY